MAYDDTMTSERTVTGFFDTREQADKAKRDLVAAGFSDASVSIVGSDALKTSTAGTESKGFWEELKEFFIPDEDRYTYAEGLRRGGYLLTVRTTETTYDRALEIVDTDGTIDIDERASTWKSEGWSGYTGATAATAAGMASGGTVSTEDMSTTRTTTGTSGMTSSGGMGTSTTGMSTSTAGISTSTSGKSSAKSDTMVDRDEAIPVMEEKLRVGKRDVNHGRVRVRSYVVETPVSEDITLRNTSVDVERKTVDRPVNASDALFQDRTIEAEQHTEEAVVDKQARVTEEIRLKKNVQERTETVSDSVKRTEVEVMDERGNKITGSEKVVGSETITGTPKTDRV